MSVWVELHCDKMGDGVNSCGKLTCYGRNGNQPGAMCDRASNVPALISWLAVGAKNAGWLIERGKYICPACRKPPNVSGNRTL